MLICSSIIGSQLPPSASEEIVVACGGSAQALKTASFCQTRRRRFLALFLRVVVSLIFFQRSPGELFRLTTSSTRVPPKAPNHIVVAVVAAVYGRKKLSLSLSLSLSSSLCLSAMGISTTTIASETSSGAMYTHRIFLLVNYILLGAASSCIFLTLSLRLLPSPCGLLLIGLHALTVAGAGSACATSSPASTARWHAAHMVATVLTAIFQGAIALLVFTRTGDFLAELRSYVREDDGAVILKMVGGLGTAIFCFEWVALALAFVLRTTEGESSGCGGAAAAMRSSKIRSEDELKDWPWPFQV